MHVCCLATWFLVPLCLFGLCRACASTLGFPGEGPFTLGSHNIGSLQSEQVVFSSVGHLLCLQKTRISNANVRLGLSCQPDGCLVLPGCQGCAACRLGWCRSSLQQLCFACVGSGVRSQWPPAPAARNRPQVFWMALAVFRPSASITTLPHRPLRVKFTARTRAVGEKRRWPEGLKGGLMPDWAHARQCAGL